MPLPRSFHLPPGRWAIGVSGGADSVALARQAVAAVAASSDPAGLVLVHLDHQLRGAESDADAAFVADLGRQLGVPVVIAPISEIEAAGLPADRNSSTRYRNARLALFRRVVRDHQLDGVLLAHHADDQAETVALRLLRGSSLPYLGGIRPSQRIDGLRIERPLLGVTRQEIREYLHAVGQPWREDVSNASLKYRRNVVRQVLAADDVLTPQLLRLSNVSQRWRKVLEARSPVLAERFPVATLCIDPSLAAFAVRRWLAERGAPPDRVSPAVCQRLIAQATDVTQPPRQHYPGRLLVRRRQKHIDVAPGAPVQSPQTHGQETPIPAEL